MTNVLPHRFADEGAADFAARLAILLDAHLSRCNACNYDTDCTACASGVSDLDATSHSCNCREASPQGYGVRLRQLFEQARADVAKEQR